jgi:CheY-like chemotaxis protein
LIVEDDPLSRKLLRVVLEGEGCKVEATTTAEEALPLIATFKPSVAVIDLILPTMSGLVLGEQLRANTGTRELLLVALTAFNGDAAEKMALEAGFDVYVKKPFDPETFCRLLAKKLGRDSR